MSDPVRILLVGATGLVGQTIRAEAGGRADVSVLALARREMPMLPGGRGETVIAPIERWGEVIARVRPDVLVSALGTTWRKAGRDEAAFRAVDEELVLATARAAVAAGVERMIAISSAGADPRARNLYLRVKGETDQALAKAGLKRLDIFRPGLLRGQRSADLRPLERAGIVLAPLIDPFLTGARRRYRSIAVRDIARAALALAQRRAACRFIHEHDLLVRAAHGLPLPAGAEE